VRPLALLILCTAARADVSVSGGQPRPSVAMPLPPIEDRENAAIGHAIDRWIGPIAEISVHVSGLVRPFEWPSKTPRDVDRSLWPDVTLKPAGMVSLGYFHAGNPVVVDDDAERQGRNYVAASRVGFDKTGTKAVVRIEFFCRAARFPCKSVGHEDLVFLLEGASYWHVVRSFPADGIPQPPPLLRR
jgi:hypothetical protein